MPFDYGNKKPDGQHEHHPGLSEDELKVAEPSRPYRDSYIHNACGVLTKMPAHCAATYQVNPKYYGSTFCCGCGNYFSVAEFRWKDGTVVGE